jgi:hypothetical protein
MLEVVESIVCRAIEGMVVLLCRPWLGGLGSEQSIPS